MSIVERELHSTSAHAVDHSWPAPAKLNLFLHVTGRRPDGYHTLETIFQFLDFGDDILLRVRDDGEIRRISDLAGVPPEEDLVVRAAKILKSRSATPLGVDIGVKKRVPMGGGLGGGSSDAATTLVGLNHIWALGFDVETLAGIGLGLGADVPVFVRGRASFASGIGEDLVPIGLEEPWYLVIYPGCPVATKEIFNAPDLTRATPPIRIRGLSGENGVDPSILPALLTRTRNDCEAVARARYPEVNAALEWLAKFGGARMAEPRMTGTGACVFAPFRRFEEANEVLSRLPNTHETGDEEETPRTEAWFGFVSRGRNRSPLRYRKNTNPALVKNR
uniref:4-diphosphocytidyl-2-C-methyl-D-erythritol kinase n=1 Tax=Candidatus Kentrum sp. SD TaxID=2126332 RepID=A0A450YW72_9GAMM|nr:MAG: 4-diphosphocytidyl-2-C-methyl-D-erythritol kinase [Candidatus Kentron sp. SD]VFK45798.1 MAG: 4-diphosphocytidyl-2-C-methyl-D-erythritol kinase [Candidatus Kentron sp. SD]